MKSIKVCNLKFSSQTISNRFDLKDTTKSSQPTTQSQSNPKYCFKKLRTEKKYKKFKLRQLIVLNVDCCYDASRFMNFR